MTSITSIKSMTSIRSMRSMRSIRSIRSMRSINTVYEAIESQCINQPITCSIASPVFTPNLLLLLPRSLDYGNIALLPYMQ